MSPAIVLVGFVALQGASWEAALKREKRTLTGEKAALQKALDDVRAGSATSKGALEKELDTLTATLARLRAENASKREGFVGRERTRSAEQQVSLSEDAIARAKVWARAKKLDVDGERASEVFASIARALSEQAHVRRTQAEVFDASGVLHAREVRRVGVVAAWVTDDGRARALEPAVGERGFEVASPARVILTKDNFEIVEAILFDPEVPHEHAPEPARGIRATLEAGGFVMYPLALLGLVALLVALERVFALARVTLSFVDSAPIKRVSKEMARGTEHALVEEHATEELLRFRSRVRARLSALNVVAAAAPLLGLLGTVTGMIGTFRVITEHGTGDPELLSGGISQALLTTQLGLAIAIPTLLVAAGINRWSQRLVSRAELAVLEKLYPDDKGEDA